jgi:hypothetical protein
VAGLWDAINKGSDDYRNDRSTTVFQSVQGVCLGAKHLGMSGLTVVGARRGRTGRRCAHVMGASSAHVRGSCYTGHGVSHWHDMWWMTCVAHCSDQRATQAYKNRAESSESGCRGQCEFYAFVFPYFFHR